MMGIELYGSDRVYKPSDDTILILSNILEAPIPKGYLGIDFGSGSGILSIGVAKRGIYCLAIDIDYESLSYTVKNSRLNMVDGLVDPILSGEYLDVLRSGLDIFCVSNPPYLPGDRGEESIHWAGGLGGVEVAINLIYSLNRFRNVEALIVLSSYSNTKLFTKHASSLGFKIKVIDEMRFPGEIIYLYRVWRGDHR